MEKGFVMNTRFSELKKNLGFGCMRLPMKGEEVDYDEFNKMIDAYMEAGFNYFDTAHNYISGKSETAIRECLVKRYPRESYILVDKLTNLYFEKEEYLTSRWVEGEENGRKRKYYKITEKGIKELASQKQEWETYSTAVGKVLTGELQTV